MLFRSVRFGIFSGGQSAANPNTGTVIVRNDLSATAINRVRRVGILLSNDDGALISENRIGGIDSNELFDAIGIALGIQAVGVNIGTPTTFGITNATVSRNKIDGVTSSTTDGFSAVGIAVAGGIGVNTLSNNMITGVNSNATNPDIVAGIFVAGVTRSEERRVGKEC